MFQPIQSEDTTDSCRCEFIRTEDIAHNPASEFAPTDVAFHAATNLDIAAIAKVQAQIRRRILQAFVRRGLIDKSDRAEMMSWEHGGGFSLDASVRISSTDRAGLERLLRYCARPLHWNT